MRNRAKTTLGFAAVATVAIAAPALATPPTGSGTPSGTTVTTTTTGPGTRQLKVLDMAGAPLSSLSLQPSVPQGFHVAVTDSAVGDLANGFTVSAVMNNLYATTGPSSYNTSHTAGTFVPSSAVTVNMPASGALSAFGVGLDALPNVISTAGSIPSCTTLSGVTGLTDILTTATALCGVGGPLLTSLSVPAVTAVSTVSKTLSGLTDLTKLPFGLSDTVPAGGGAFTNADYTSGIGAADSTGANGAPAPTSFRLLQAIPVSDLTNLIAALGLPTGLPLVSVDGTGAYTTVAAFESALQATGNATLQNLVTDLTPLTGAQQAQVLNYLTGTLSTTLANLSNELGTYNSFPTLKVTPPAGTPAATYSGTMTVTMVQP